MTIAKTIVAGACAIAAASLSTPAFAEPATHQIAVSYPELDLTREADVRKLERRVVRAARRLCDRMDEVGTFVPRALQRCVRRIVEDNAHRVKLAVAKAETERSLAAR